MFDSTKSGRIEKEKVRTILNTLGHTFDDHELEVLLKQEDDEGIVFSILCVSIALKLGLRQFQRVSRFPLSLHECYSIFWVGANALWIDTFI